MMMKGLVPQLLNELSSDFLLLTKRKFYEVSRYLEITLFGNIIPEIL